MAANKVYVPKYTSTEQDVTWAGRGMVATILIGEAIPMLQRIIFDVGFEKLVIIPLGADKVLLRSEDEEDVSIIMLEAADFFDNFFSTPKKWNKDFVVRESGAWVRIYGVPLHAWNLDFLKLCVYDCGRLLRVDDFTIDKVCIDYARVLISTSTLDIINTGAKVMVDGALFDFKIVEEWGFSLGKDACLGDDEESQGDDESRQDGVHDEVAASGDVDNLLNHLSEEWNKEHIDNQARPSPISKGAVTGLEA